MRIFQGSFIWLLLTPLWLFSQEYSMPAVYYGRAADNRIAGANVVRESNYGSIPSYIEWRKGMEVPVAKLEDWINEAFGLGEFFGLELTRVSNPDVLGQVHYRYRQTYKGIPIELAVFIAHTSNGMVHSMSGFLATQVEERAGPPIEEKDAYKAAIDRVSASLYRWEAESSSPPAGKLVYVHDFDDLRKAPRLAWKFDIYAYEPLYRADVYIDAVSRSVIFEHNKINTVNDSGIAVTGYSGTRTIIADSAAPDSFILRETGRGDGIETYDLNTTTSYGSAVDFVDSNNYWNNINAALDEYATDAHWGTEVTYDYFWQRYARNSIDDNGFKLMSYVHYGVNYGNAFWDGQRMTYGDGSSGKPFQALDVCGHEVTHGLTSNTSDLVYQKEPGALNESFSDIFGTAIEFYAKGGAANWLMGEDLGSAFRDMKNPKAKGDPSCYKGVNWHTSPSDNYGVHTNSGVQNHWFYVLSDGETGTNDNGDAYSVTGVGIDDAGAIAFRNNTVYLFPTAEYSDARFFSIQSAIDLFGPCTQEVVATANAWYAVCVGGPYDSTVKADFIVQLQASCSAPFYARFTNYSTNGAAYSWDFGDGSPADSQFNPSHWYTQYGLYNVRLVADGGSCGADTMVKTGYISIDSANPCVVIMPTSGNAQKQTACKGTVYDDGGPVKDYSNNTHSTVTIEPPGATSIMLLFPVFSMEPGSANNCDYDYMEIYDGPTTASPLLGRWCNDTGPPDTIMSGGGSITILQHSDGGLTFEGFMIEWQCFTPSSPPMASFTADVTTTCNGEVMFFDHSVGNPTGWYWDFGDGKTSNQQNALHVFGYSGTFTIMLVASNANGTDTFTRSDYITITRPAPLTVTNDSACGPASLTLGASGSVGSVYWYDTSYGGSPIYLGPNFITPSLTQTKSYYAEDRAPDSIRKAGPVDDSIGPGGYINNLQYLIFNVYRPCTLVSVWVDADTTKSRTIELRNSSGGVLQSQTSNIPAGQSRIILNFLLSPGTAYQLGVGSAEPRLYRNTGGTAFPYVLPGWAEITGSSVSNYYFFFYDWEVQGPDCVSERSEAVAFIKAGTTVTISGPARVCEDDSVTITASGGANYVWSTGATTDSITVKPVTSPQTYTVISNAECDTDTLSHMVTVDSLPKPAFTYLQNNRTFTFFNQSRLETSIQWDFGDGNTSIEQNPTHVYTNYGIYIVVLTATNGCGSVEFRDTIIITDPSAVMPAGAADQVALYPNPSEGLIYISSGSSIEVVVFNKLGQRVAHVNGGSKVTIDFTGLQKGVYTFCIKPGHSRPVFRKVVLL